MTASSLSTGSCTERRRIEQRVEWVDGWVGGEESHSRLLCNVFRYSTYVEKKVCGLFFCPNFPGNFERARSSGKSRRRGIVVKDWASKQAKREGLRTEVSREGPRGGAWRAGRHGEHGEAEEHEDAEAWRRGPRTRGAPRGGRVGDLHAQQLPLQRRGRSQGYRVQQAHGNQGRCEFS